MTSPLPPLDDCPVAAGWLITWEEKPAGMFCRTQWEAEHTLWNINAYVDLKKAPHTGLKLVPLFTAEAIAAAQADYEQRIRSALVPVAAPVAADRDAKPAAWLGYHPETNHTGTTELRSVAEMWEQDGIEVTPLYVSTITADKAEIARLTAERDEAVAGALAYSMVISNSATNLARAEASEARCAALMAERDGMAEALKQLNVTDEELLRLRNRCEGKDYNILVWAKMLQKLVDHIRDLRARAALEAQERTA